ncbi:hypothetical protein [Catellatospora chokoriensis]|uniref:PPE family protein n=1 Tax=Catellatospora chokoriensis TaxID=310353 RepID=A0A8J3NSD9_9ACTN|nr:hypothetical protein [Catellatospora chokoriensis]GIF90446.1 hypothetical protein Cch02nite_38900 [Catellatospora chokoriensis]
MSGQQYVPPTNTAITPVVKGEFVGPVQTVFTAQPDFIAFCTNWDAFDVPRLWDSVRAEDDPAAWKQAHGWENLGQMLADQHDRLLRLREALAAGWDPIKSPAARVFFRVLDGLLVSMREDAYAHTSTARGVDGILTTLKTAKQKLDPLKREWDDVTTDWLPEWWDNAADDLNRQGRAALEEVDKAVKDYRRRIVIPAEYDYRVFSSDVVGGPTTPPGPGRGLDPRPGVTPGGGTPRPPRAVTPGGNPPPPVPGYDPVLDDGPVLEGAPQPVPAVPGSPISVLPVPPGSPYAPHGGAYVLPGPGVGRGGWIHPMPISTSTANTAAAGRPAAGGVTGAVPVAAPMGGPGARGRADGRGGQRGGDVVWEVARGVPPVIGQAPDPLAASAAAQGSAVEAAFVDWFADVATPWTNDLKVNINRGTDRPT